MTGLRGMFEKGEKKLVRRAYIAAAILVVFILLVSAAIGVMVYCGVSYILENGISGIFEVIWNGAGK